MNHWIKLVSMTLMLGIPLSATDWQKFYQAGTDEAREILSRIPEADLQSEYAKLQDKLAPEDRRRLWLYETLESRRADSVASRRLVYLYAALIALFALIAAFVAGIYRSQRRLERLLEPGE